MLGSALIPRLAASRHAVVATDIARVGERPWGPDGPTLSHLDVRRRDEIDEAIDAVEPELVAHLAAETSLEVCETHPDAAFITNAIGTRNIALSARAAGIPMAYISTAGVFDGRKNGAYDEFDTPNPINVYGASKFHGERVVDSLVPEHYIVRAGWMVGGGPGQDHKFVARMLRQVDDGATVLHAVTDKLGTPTYAVDFSRCFEQLVTSGEFGLYHMCGIGGGSRFDVARHILDVIGRGDIDLRPVGSEFFAEEFFAARPPSEQMRNRMLDLLGMNTMRPWQDAIEDYLLTYFPTRVRRVEAVLS
jgi:dTDP-4-dehydrorhamnose reductase